MALPHPKKPQPRDKKWVSSLDNTIKSKSSWRSIKKSISTPAHGYQSHKKSTGGSWLIFIILLIGALLGWIYRDSLSKIFTDTTIDTGKNITGEYTLFVGKEVTFTGTLERNPSTRYSYTHTLQDNNYGTIGLRSSMINLYELQGEVSLHGKVVDFTNNMYIVEVSSIVTPSTGSGSDILYFATPWVLVQNITKDGFSITQNTTTKTISIVNPTTNAQINIRYFTCTSEKTYDCKQFEESFSTTSGAQSVDMYGNKFYKLNDANTWFANLENRYGIYIETSHEQLFPMIMEKIQFITTEWAEKYLITTAKTLCKTSDARLQMISSWSLVSTMTWFVWNIIGTDTNLKDMNCLLSFNPEDLTTVTASLAIKSGFDPVNEVTATWSVPVVDTKEPIVKEPSTSLPTPSTNQFPLKPGKEILFSTRGMTIVFPSPNISFVSTTISEWPQELQCNAQTNIVEYAKKDQIVTNPSVSLYFCTGTIPSSLSSSYRIIPVGTTTILVQVNDASWVNFANAITIN